ncbi:hypothetical protein EAO71_16755 [Streptomyces sp. ms191]|nr:hypothetical protein EAO71_16755 [Streptomyces sp. ms191]
MRLLHRPGGSRGRRGWRWCRRSPRRRTSPRRRGSSRRSSSWSWSSRPDYAAQAPYNAVVVELAEAPRIRLVGNVVTAPDAPLDSVDPARLRIGAAVKVAFTEVDGFTVPRWLLERG